MPKATLATKVAAIERLTALFKLERIVHLIVTSIALAMLLTTAGILLSQGRAGSAELTGLFGSSGLIAASSGRLLFMWTKALQILVDDSVRENP